MDTDTSEFNSNQPVRVKVSRLAITAIICAIIGLLFLPYILRHSNSEEIENYYIKSEMNLKIACFLNFSMFAVSIILGFISFIRIEKCGGKVTGTSLALGAIILSLFAGFLVVFSMSIFNARRVAHRMICGTNLSAIGKAMLIYAHDYNEEFPLAGNRGSTWGSSVKWNAATRQAAYGLASDGTDGSATISSSLYLLVKYDEVPTEAFLCAGEIEVSEFKVRPNVDLTQLWDFGPQPWKHNSYSYHMPYSSYALTSSSNPGMAVAADRNPWIPSVGWKVKDFKEFDPDGDESAAKIGNTPTHANEGQNVLYLDSHVSFEMDSSCGINGDNIYTSWNGKDISEGTSPKFGSQPADKEDSLIVNDPPAQNP